MDLVDCSDTLSKINHFAATIEQLSNNIKDSVRDTQHQEGKPRHKEDRLVQKAESMVRKGRFVDAVSECLKDKEM